jgi:multidrug efflux pump subunit AcrA (membrane-fusion protein)
VVPADYRRADLQARREEAEVDVKLNALVVSVAAAALAVGCAPAALPAAKGDTPPVAVSLGRADTVDLAAPFEAGGVVRARSTAVIASRIMAPVTDVLVRPGDRVRRGAPLVRLDAREINAAGDRAAAALAAARQAADAAAADVRATDASLRIARLTRDRVAALHAKRSATPQELDQADASLNAAEAQMTSAGARAAAAAAARDEAQAAVQSAQITMSYTVLSAPFDGLVTERSVDPGTMATPGAPLLTLDDSVGFRLEVKVDEARAAQVAVGAAAEVSLETTSPAAWSRARVVEVARLDAASHGFVVKLEVPDGAPVRSGQFGRARFQGLSRRTLTVPAAALLRRGQLTFVFAADADGLARLRPVSIGAAAADRVEVLAGVHDGDRLVLDPPASLSDGARIAGDRR